MSTPPSSAKPPRKPPPEERRAHPNATPAPPGSLRHLKGLLGRPIGLERRDGQLHVVLVERRRTPRPGTPPSLEQLRGELRARLLSHRMDNAAQVMRHLVFVHDELGRRGWPGVEVLPATVLARAAVQAEMLASEETTPALALLVDRLRLLQAAAELRAERALQAQAADEGAPVKVSDATYEEFDEAERSWMGAVPPALLPPGSGS